MLNVLLPQDVFPHDDVVWGIVYTIDPTHAVEVKAYLGKIPSRLNLRMLPTPTSPDYREKV